MHTTNDFAILFKAFTGKVPAKMFLLTSDKSEIQEKNFMYSHMFYKGKMQNIEGFNKYDFDFINNRDGSMRWVYPTDLKYPSFLNFYNNTSLRAKVFKFIVAVCFMLGLKFLIRSGRFSFYSKEDIFPFKLVKKYQCNSFSIFTGTIGPNRKILIELNANTESNYFVKIPLNKESEKLIRNEFRQVDRIRKNSFSVVKNPRMQWLEECKSLVASNIKPQNLSSNDQIKDLHFDALDDMYKDSKYGYSLKLSPYYYNFKSIMDAAKNVEFLHPLMNELKLNIKKLFRKIDLNKRPVFGLSHGDFTPWNLYEDQNKLYLYDWELSYDHHPLLFDAYHYVFQSEILLKQHSFIEVKKEIERIRELSACKNLVKKYGIDFDLNYQLYLLWNIGYYLNLYQKQKKLHVQAFWLMEVWNEALKFELAQTSAHSYRELFIVDLFDKINPINHVILKKRKNIDELVNGNSDIDFLIKKHDLIFFIEFAKKSSLVKKINIQNKSFMQTIAIHFEDGSFLSLDLLFAFKRKSIEYLEAENIFHKATNGIDNLRVPHQIHDFEYTYLFYLLNHKKVDLRHKHFFLDLGKSEKVNILDYMNRKYAINAKTLSDLFENFEKYYSTIFQKIKTYPENTLFNRIRNSLFYLLDLFYQLIRNQSMTISFSGVDGAGKSTIINEIKNNLQKKYRKRVVVLRHRPQILPILSSYKYGRLEAERKASETLPRMGKNKNILSSVLRFSYYFLDYLFGQVYIFIRYTMRDYIILYDRFYFDFINDDKRSNIQLNKSFVKSLYHFLIKPRLNIFLYANPETILSRKQELDEKSITEMNEKYIDLFDSYTQKSRPEKYISIENLDKSVTIETIMNEYLKLA